MGGKGNKNDKNYGNCESDGNDEMDIIVETASRITTKTTTNDKDNSSRLATTTTATTGTMIVGALVNTEGQNREKVGREQREGKEKGKKIAEKEEEEED